MKFLFKLIPFSVFICLNMFSIAQDSKIMVIGEGVNVKINPGTKIGIVGGVEFLSDSIECKGKLIFNNFSEESSTLKGDYSLSTFEFLGAGKHFINNDIVVNSFLIEADADVEFKGNLTVKESCDLLSGKVIMGENKLLIESDIETALKGNSDSYVIGNLSRKVKTSRSYIYPLGSANGYYPLVMENLVEDDVVNFKFDSSIAKSVVINGASLEQNYGWESNGGNPANKFSVRLFVGSDVVAKNPQVTVITKGEALGKESYFFGDYIGTSNIVDIGKYCVAVFEKLNLTNILVANSEFGLDAFRVIDDEDYDRIELEVFDRVGKVVFSSKDYKNEFRASNYPSGTYFYKMYLYKNGKKIERHKYIEIRHDN